MADENKAITMFNSLRSQSKDTSDDVSKTLKRGFDDIKKSMLNNMSNVKNSSKPSSSAAKQKVDRNFNNVSSINKSLQKLVKIEEANLKLRKASLDKNRFSVKDNIKKEKKEEKKKSTNLFNGVGGIIKTTLGSLFKAPIALLTKGAGMILSLFGPKGMMLRAATALLGSPLIKGLASGSASLIKSGMTALLPAIVSTLPVLLPAILTTAFISKIRDHLDKRTVEKNETAASVQSAMADPTKTIKSRFKSLGEKKFSEYTDDDIRVIAQEATQGFSTGKERTQKRSSLIKEMTSARDNFNTKSALTRKEQKIANAKAMRSQQSEAEFWQSLGGKSAGGMSVAQGKTPQLATVNNNITVTDPMGQDSSMMKLSQNGLNFIFKKEGFAARPFWDHKQWSWGYGTRVPGSVNDPNKNPGGTITKEQAAVEARAMMSTYTNGVRNKFKGLSLTQSQFDAFTSFAYNLGPGQPLANIAESFKNGGPEAAANRMKLYNKASGKVNEGLTRRRAEEANMLFAANGMILNGKKPVIAGEAGPEAIIPLNNQGAEFMSEVMNKAIQITANEKLVRRESKTNSSDMMKEYLSQQFIPKLAREVAKAMASSAPSNNNGGMINVY